ncbi:MAG: hypothetical protein NTX40_00140 [Planctomycetota bacterium]|nr:hypothetical protein [Planctomycetota bacterium]
MKRRRGFVLLMVLVVLAIAGTVLAAGARRCGEEALQASAEERTLQQKWGALSLEALLLPLAEQVLTRPDEESAEGPTAIFRAQVTLGAILFEVVLADEQAKANANLLAHRKGEEGLAESLRVLQAHAREVLQVHLRPIKPSDEAAGTFPVRYASLEQLYAAATPTTLLGPDAQNPGPASSVTCWGSGQVNLRRVDVAVLREVLSGLLSETDLSKIEDFRRKTPEATATQMLDHLDLGRERRAAVEPLVTDRSLCHSLWTIAVAKTRRVYRLAVLETGAAASAASVRTFAWGP